MPSMSKINSPLPQDLSSECRKAAQTLNSFVKPHGKGLDSVIPVDIISSAKGLAIMTVIKAGFLWSGRFGSGIVIARTPDGGWSAPSAIGTAGVGVGGQIGAELTDFVIILNTLDAVKAFSMGGNVTLGGNLSVSAGPIGRTAEAGGAIGKLAAIFTYSKSKGLFAGISLEGSVIMERKDANATFYRRKISAKEILSGTVERPETASDLYRALDMRAGSSTITSPPPYATGATSPTSSSFVGGVGGEKPRGPAPTIPPRTGAAQSGNTAVALFDYVGERPDDLSFRKGDIIQLVKKTDSQNDWWVGCVNGRTGNFPANYTKLQ